MSDHEPYSFSKIAQNRHFMSLWGCQVLSQMADKVLFLLLVVLITSASTANSSISLLTIIYTIPTVFFGPIAGVFVDRWNKKWILIASNLLRALLVISIPYFDKSFTALYTIVFLVALAAVFFTPAEAAMIPAVVEKRGLLTANSLFTTTMIASIILGFALGDPILRLFGKQAYSAVAGMYAFAVLLAMLLPHKAGLVHAIDQSDFWNELKAGLAYIRERRVIQVAIVEQVILYSAFAALSILVIGFVRDILQMPERYFGYILSMAGVGMAFGAYAVARFASAVGKRAMITTGFLALGGALLLLAEATRVPESLLYAAIIGAAAALIAIPVNTLMQEQTDGPMRGKVFGVQNTVINLASTIPMALAGFAADFSDVKFSIILTGIIVMTGSLLDRFYFTPIQPPDRRGTMEPPSPILQGQPDRDSVKTNE